MKNPRYIIAFAAFTFVSFHFPNLQAQTDSTKSVYNESVIVVGDYNPVLDGVTEKVNVAPAVTATTSENAMPSFSYSITPRRMSSLSSTTGIKAAKITASPSRLYNNYMRFGIGHDFAAPLDFTPLADLYYTSTRHDNYALGARLFHQTDVTTFGKKDDNKPSPDHYGRTRQSISRIDLFGKYILNKNHVFSADLVFDREYGRYYGFSDSMLFDHLALYRDKLKNYQYKFAYNNVALNLGAKSLNTDEGKLGYEANIGLADLWCLNDANQLSMDLDANVHYGFPMFRQYKAIAYLQTKWNGFRQKYKTPAFASGLPLGYDSSVPLPDTVDDGRTLFTIGPYVDFLLKDIKFHVGFAIGVNGYDTSSSHANFFPDIALAKSFYGNTMSLTIGLRGDFKANDWNNIRLLNPYVEPAPLSMATVTNDLYAHFRINFSKRLMLNVNADNKFNKNNMYFELNKNYVLNNVFTPYYVDDNTIHLGIDFTFVNDEMISLTLGIDYNDSYNVPENVPMLYDINFTSHLDAVVNYKNKWFFTLNTRFFGRCDADYRYNSPSGVYEITTTLPARFGIALAAEYVHSRALSFFAKLDNMTFQRYYLWANYPASRFDAMLGLTYTFPKQ